MSVGLWSVIGLVVSAVLAGIGYVLRKGVNSTIALGQAKKEAQAARETTERVIHDNEVAKRIDAEIDAMSDNDVSGRLRKWGKVPKQ